MSPAYFHCYPVRLEIPEPRSCCLLPALAGIATSTCSVRPSICFGPALIAIIRLTGLTQSGSTLATVPGSPLGQRALTIDAFPLCSPLLSL